MCEEEDGWMGHSYHILYNLDFVNPKRPYEAALLVADSYLLMCTDPQKQLIESIRFRPADHPVEIGISLRHGRNRLSREDRNNCANGKSVSPPRMREFRVDFLVGQQLLVAPSSRNSLKPFVFR